MNAEELNAAQAPLKEQYQAEPQRAVITLRAAGQLGDEDVSGTVRAGGAELTVERAAAPS